MGRRRQCRTGASRDWIGLGWVGQGRVGLWGTIEVLLDARKTICILEKTSRLDGG